METKRVFTDQELREIEEKTLDLILEAIDAGDRERAKELT